MNFWSNPFSALMNKSDTKSELAIPFISNNPSLFAVLRNRLVGERLLCFARNDNKGGSKAGFGMNCYFLLPLSDSKGISPKVP